MPLLLFGRLRDEMKGIAALILGLGICVLFSGCGGVSFRENLAVGEFVGELKSVPEGSFEMFLDLEFRRSGRVHGWGKIEPDRYVTVEGTVEDSGLLEFVAKEDVSGEEHSVSGVVGVVRVTMSGRVERRFGGQMFEADLELVRIDPLLSALLSMSSGG